MTLGEILPIVLVVIGGTGSVIAYVKSDVTKRTISSLQELADALDKRVCALEEERDVLINKVDRLEQENEVLRSLVTGEHATETLLEVMVENHRTVMEAINKLTDR